jgi:hypothetical protein
MQFIYKSVPYSVSILLKTKILKDSLEKYNRFISTKLENQLQGPSVIVPNNNKKYFCLITKKRALEPTKEDFDIIYFFSNDFEDFFVETKGVLPEQTATDGLPRILLEGYLYNKDNKYNFLATDYLVHNNDVVDCDYNLRYTLLNECLLPIRQTLTNINNNISIGIHCVFEEEKRSVVNVFMENFSHKEELVAVEYIQDFCKRIETTNIEKPNATKIVQKTSYADVYNVYNDTTHESEGILYVKGVEESKRMMSLCKLQGEQVHVNCKFNVKFNKWEPDF